jgi:hypothetical protein
MRTADELERAGHLMERVALQRARALRRRAEMVKRHLAQDVRQFAEDAASEYEVEARRALEGQRSLSRTEVTDLNSRVGKDLERRFQQLVQRYQEELEAIDLDVAEWCAELAYERSRGLASADREALAKLAPPQAMGVRLGANLDEASGTMLGAGAITAVAVGAGVHTGFMGAAAVVSIATGPIGLALIGALSLAAVWKMFSSPVERSGSDLRERAAKLKTALHTEIAGKVGAYEDALDDSVGRFTTVAAPQVAGILAEAARLREVASNRHTLATAQHQNAVRRLDQLLALSAG